MTTLLIFAALLTDLLPFLLIILLMFIIGYFSERQGKFGDRDHGDWLRVLPTEHSEKFKIKGWHPDYTCIESSYEPVVRKLTPEDWWRIEFICPRGIP